MQVAICAGSDVVHPYAAVIIGAVAGLVYIIVVRLVVKARVDDPVDAVAGKIYRTDKYIDCCIMNDVSVA